MPDNRDPVFKAQHAEAQRAAVLMINHLIDRGLDWRAVLSGVGEATADVIATKIGPHAVPPWFEAQADWALGLINGSN